MKVKPPKNALAFLRWFCREDYLEEIEGDLLEIFQKDLNISAKTAKRNFLWNVLRSFRIRNLKSVKMPHIRNTLDMSSYYIKIGWRNLFKTRTTTFLNILGLTLGLTCSLILFVFIRYESSFDTNTLVEDPIYRIVQHTKFPEQTLYWNTTAYPLADALRSDFPEMGLVTQTAGPVTRTISIIDRANYRSIFEDGYVLFVDTFYAKLFDLQWIEGSAEIAFKDPNSIVLTESSARKYFGTKVNLSALIGTMVTLDEEPLQITGIIGDAPGNLSLRYHLLAPYEFYKEKNNYFATNWSGNYQGTTFVSLSHQTNSKSAEEKIDAWKSKYLNHDDDQRISYHLQPLDEIHTEVLYGSSPGSYTMPQKLLRTGRFIALFILLIAIVNFINLVTAKSKTRMKEVAVRKVSGGTRLSLIKQFVVENILVVGISLMISIFMAEISFGFLNSFLTIIHLQLSFQSSDILLIIFIGIISALLATIYPALVISAYRPIQIFKNGFQLNRMKRFSLRKSLTLLQFTLVQLFVIAAIIVAYQMQFIRNSELGFSSDQVIVTPAPDFDQKDVFQNSLLENKDIQSVAFGSGPPMAVEGRALGTTFRIPGQPKMEGQEAELKIAGKDYFDFYDLKIIAGRGFKENKESFDEFVVNERLLGALNWTPEQALGKNIEINEGQAQIVGIVRDFHNNSLQYDITPCVFTNWKYFHDHAFIKVAKGNMPPLSFIETRWKKNYPASVYAYHFLDESIEKEYLVENLIQTGFTIFSILVIIIGCLGIFGLMSFITLQKRKEVGIRKVLGASMLQIINYFSKEFIFLILISFLMSAPICYYLLDRWLVNFSYRIELTVGMFLLGGTITLLIALITSGFQTIGAALVSPVESLRSE